MKKTLLISLTLAFSPAALAEIPESLTCHNSIGSGATLSHYFAFRKNSRDASPQTFPQTYSVLVKAIKTLPGSSRDPNAPVGSNDPNRADVESIVLLDERYLGLLDPADTDLIRFADGEGFIRVDWGNMSGILSATFMPPGALLPQLVENCEILEPGVTVHN